MTKAKAKEKIEETVAPENTTEATPKTEEKPKVEKVKEVKKAGKVGFEFNGVTYFPNKEAVDHYLDSPATIESIITSHVVRKIVSGESKYEDFFSK